MQLENMSMNISRKENFSKFSALHAQKSGSTQFFQNSPKMHFFKTGQFSFFDFGQP